ncbi:MAG: FMN-binding protein [Faecalibacterium prausnitzii]
MSGVTAGALAACNTASSSTAAPAASGAAGTYIPGTYEGTAEGISSTVKVTMTFSDSAVTDVVVDTSGETASFGAAAADQLREQLMAAGSAEIDGVSGSTITSDAVMKAAKSCYAQAKGEATVTSVQLPTGDETDWLGRSLTSTRLPSPRPWTPTSSSSALATAVWAQLLTLLLTA